jgi:hypothetical protein
MPSLCDRADPGRLQVTDVIGQFRSAAWLWVFAERPARKVRRTNAGTQPDLNRSAIDLIHTRKRRVGNDRLRVARRGI